MLTLDDLCSRARPAAADAAVPTVRLAADDEAVALLSVFAADEPPDAVRLVVDGQPVGELRHEDVLDLFPLVDKAFGSSAGSIVPGEAPARAYAFVVLRCPVPDCPASPVTTLHFDASDPPTCDVHPDRVLEREP